MIAAAAGYHETDAHSKQSPSPEPEKFRLTRMILFSHFLRLSRCTRGAGQSKKTHERVNLNRIRLTKLEGEKESEYDYIEYPDP